MALPFLAHRVPHNSREHGIGTTSFACLHLYPSYSSPSPRFQFPLFPKKKKKNGQHPYRSLDVLGVLGKGGRNKCTNIKSNNRVGWNTGGLYTMQRCPIQMEMVLCLKKSTEWQNVQ